MAIIEAVSGMEVLDSRGNPTVMARVRLADGARGWAIAPSGASTGSREACELRDGDAGRFGGKGVLKAVANVEGPLAQAVAGMDAADQGGVDQAMLDADGTPNKARMGANAMLAVSLAVLKAAAQSDEAGLHERVSGLAGQAPLLPIPLMNILNGGAHAAGSTDFQEFMVAPIGFASFREALRAGVEIYAALGRILKKRGLSVNVGDEGGYAPGGLGNREALEVVVQAVEAAGYEPGRQVRLALDVAANELLSDGRYELRRDGRSLSGEELCAEYVGLCRDFPIFSLEDPFAEDDWSSWNWLTKQVGPKVQVVGDDLFVTQAEYVERGVREGSANAVLVKLNQVGTVTETLATMELARRSGFKCVVSHRSGESEDAYISDLAVGSGAGQIKTGAPARGERTAKYNRLLVVEEALGDGAAYAGASWSG